MAQPDGIPRVIHGGAQAVFQDFLSLAFLWLCTAPHGDILLRNHCHRGRRRPCAGRTSFAAASDFATTVR